jgi:hypothetical protein
MKYLKEKRMTNYFVQTWTLEDINQDISNGNYPWKPLDYVSSELTPFVGRFVKAVQFFKISPKITVCLLSFQNGFDVIGESGCVNPEHYSTDIGSKYALKKAVDNASPIIAYQEQTLLQETGTATYDTP